MGPAKKLLIAGLLMYLLSFGLFAIGMMLALFSVDKK
jgi:hypothetical protein